MYSVKNINTDSVACRPPIQIALLFLPAIAIFTLFLTGITYVSGLGSLTISKYIVFFGLISIFILFSKNKVFSNRLLISPLICFVIVGFLSTTWSASPEISFARATFNAISLILFCLMLLKSNVSDVKKIIDITFVLITITTFVVTFIDMSILKSSYSYFQGNYRGAFYNSNYLGQVIGLICMPWLATGIFFSRSIHRYRFYKIIFILSFLFFLYVILETRSRASIIACLFSLTLIIAWFSKQKKGLSRISIMICFILSICFIGTKLTFLIDKYNTGYNEAIDAFSTRGYLWFAHIEKIIERPILGWGLGVNPVNFKDLSTFGDSEKGNSLIAIVEELGLFPCFLLLPTLLPLLKRIISKTKLIIRSNGLDRGDVICISFLFSSLFHSNIESWLFYYGNPFAYLMILAAYVLTSKKIRKESY